MLRNIKSTSKSNSIVNIRINSMSSTEIENDPQHQSAVEEQAQEKELQFKEVVMEVLHALLNAHEKVHSSFYYALMGIEFLQIFYYVTHPLFPFYSNSELMPNLHSILKFLVFNQFLSNDSDLYQVIIPFLLGFLLIEAVLLVVIVKEVQKQKQVTSTRITHIVLNAMFLIWNSILTIPIIGTSISVLLCNPESPYSHGQNCYSGTAILFCMMATLLIVGLVIQCAVYWYAYYNKNPFGKDTLAKYDNHAALGKFFLKILPVVYLAVDFKLQYLHVFIFGLTLVFCAYLFLFRMFTFHDFNEGQFYTAYFLDIVLTWFTVNNLLVRYLDPDNLSNPLVESVLCSTLLAVLLLKIEHESYEKILLEGLEADKVKKQNLEKFLYHLIFKFVHDYSEASKNDLQTTLLMLESKLKNKGSKQEQTYTTGNKLQNEFYFFLSRFIEEHLEPNSSPMIFALRCELLAYEKKYPLAFHQSLELSNKKVSMAEELLSYRFRRKQAYEKESFDAAKRESSNIFNMYYEFNLNLMRLQEEISRCALNNLDFWEEVCESSPSVHKIRNLARKYEVHRGSIDHFYNQIYLIFPSNMTALKIYIDFLMYVGVSIKDLQKSEERLKLAEQNIRKARELERGIGNLIQMGENENLAYLSIETSEINLGAVLNCNSVVKNILGYDRSELVGKKVTKLMPKSFNEFHDSLVRGHLQTKQFEQRNKVERVVYALNKSNFLVEVALFTQVNYQTIGERHGLEMIGFLKKIDDQEKAVAILEMNSNNLIGVNRKFSKIIENGISSSEFSNGHIKIQTLFPNISLEGIQSLQTQKTNLVFSSSSIVTKSGLNLEVKKKVEISVEKISEYSSSKQKIAYLTVKELYCEEFSKYNLKHSRDQQKSNQKLTTLNKLTLNEEPHTGRNHGARVLSSQVSISEEINTQQTFLLGRENLNNNTHNKQYHMIERKKEDYLKNQFLDIFRCILWTVLAAFIVSNVSIMIYKLFWNLQFIDSNLSLQKQLKQSYILTYEQARIAKNVERVIHSSLYSEAQWSTYTKTLSSSTEHFSDSFVALMTNAEFHSVPLEFNQENLYQFLIGANNDGSYNYANESLINSYFQFLSVAKSFAETPREELLQTDPTHLVDKGLLVLENSKTLLPGLAKNNSLGYLSIEKSEIQEHKDKEILILILYCLVSLVSFAVFGFLINKINIFNVNVIDFYNQIKLWDAYEMKAKCIRYIERTSKSGAKKLSKRRISSLLNVFPVETLLKVIEPSSEQYKNINSELNHSEDENLLQLQNQDGMRQSRKSRQQKRNSVNLSEKNRLKQKFIIISAVSVILSLVLTAKYFNVCAYSEELAEVNQKVSDLGKVRDNMAYSSFYAYQTMLHSQNNSHWKQLFRLELSEFYHNADTCYQLISDPSRILKDSYSVFDELSTQIFNQSVGLSDQERFSIRSEGYELFERLLERNIDSISEIIDNDMNSKTTAINDYIELINILCAVGYILMALVLTLFIKYWILEEVIRNSGKSKSMVMMLPPWLIERNKALISTIQ